MELVFFNRIRSDAQRKKEKAGKRGRTVLIHLFWGADPQNLKFNLLASSHHHISIRLELTHFFLKYAEATVAALSLFGITAWL